MAMVMEIMKRNLGIKGFFDKLMRGEGVMERCWERIKNGRFIIHIILPTDINKSTRPFIVENMKESSG